MTADILIVVDEPAMAEWLPRHFADRGWEATCVSTESDAIAALEATAAHPPKVAIVDAVLGEGAGYALMEDIRRRHPSMVVICTSARAGGVARMKALAAGADAYIAKPFPLSELDRLVMEAARKT